MINKQFQRSIDFKLTPQQQQKSKTVIFDKFSLGFAFQKFLCQGEDVKLMYEHPQGWKYCVICNKNVDLGIKEFDLLPPQQKKTNI